jgi:protocatechuate 3,4-dioxygenase beta subunit
MRGVLVQLTVAFLLLLCLSENAAACTCVDSPSPCASFQSTPVVFVGLVSSIEEVTAEINRFGKIEKVRTALTAHFIVEEGLKGISSQEVDVVTGGGGGDCGYYFKAGERYLVYAYGSAREALGSSMSRTVVGGRSPAKKVGALTTSICGRTQPLSRAQDDLELIRAVMKGQPQTRLFGTVYEYLSKFGDFEEDAEYKPKTGLTIKVEGVSGKYEAITDSGGRFRLGSLKPGTYKVKLILPPAYGLRYSFGRTEFETEVTQGCWGGEIDFTIQVNGRIRGRVFDAQGKPVGEQVQLSIMAYESAGNNMNASESRSEYTDQQGRYDFAGLPPGRYLLGINIADVPDKHTPYSKTYYPSGSTPAQATVITLAEGQQLDDFDFHLPLPLTERTITGTVFLQNGKPAAGATLELYDLERPESSMWGINVETDAQGRFTVKGFKGRRYQLRAYLDEDYLAGKGVQSEMVEADANPGSSPVKLILNKPGIFRSQQ